MFLLFLIIIIIIKLKVKMPFETSLHQEKKKEISKFYNNSRGCVRGHTATGYKQKANLLYFLVFLPWVRLMCALRAHIKLSIFRNIFSKIEKVVITFSILKKIFSKIESLMCALRARISKIPLLLQVTTKQSTKAFRNKNLKSKRCRRMEGWA